MYQGAAGSKILDVLRKLPNLASLTLDTTSVTDGSNAWCPIIAAYAVDEMLEWKSLFQNEFDRVVCDEAHLIKNPRTRTSLSVAVLKARALWMIAATQGFSRCFGRMAKQLLHLHY
jgi:SNF2 family DNA or RNA helicase